MRFTDFKWKDLIGKKVVWTISKTVVNENTKIILPIVKAERFGFQIKDNPDKWFSYKAGHEKTVNGLAKFGAVSYCELITDEDAKALVDRWQVTKEKLRLIGLIDDNKKNLTKLSVDQLSSIVSVITDGSGDVIIDVTQVKTEAPKIIPGIDSQETIDTLSAIVAQLQSDHLQLVKKYREQLSLLNAKINNNGK